MTEENMKAFLSAQKGEINAALMYKEFANITKDEQLKAVFLEAATDEGRHANLLSKYTNQKIQPQKSQAKFLGALYRVMPKKLMFSIVAKGECAGGDGYKPYIKDYPEFEAMMNDEYRHANIFKGLAK